MTDNQGRWERDAQRAKVYRAEDHLARALDRAARGELVTARVFGSTVTVPTTELRFGNLRNVQDYLGRIGYGSVRVVERRSNGKAHYQAGTIALASQGRSRERWAMRETVVLHELAHHLSPMQQHGPRFAGNLLKLITEHVGAEAGLLLTEAYTMEGVQWS